MTSSNRSSDYDMDDCFLTIANPSKIEIKVKGSRFIGETAITATVKRAQEYLNSVRKREHAATHHCYAYSIGTGQNTKHKFSDDGEPVGTAGKPILDCITGRDLTGTILIVTRYFGGTKLGTGGLVRAYMEAANRVLDKSGVLKNYITDSIKLALQFSFYDQMIKLIQKYEGRLTQSEFADQILLGVEIRKSNTSKFLEAVTELTRGKAKIEK